MMLSVVIPTHNPNQSRLLRTLEGLKKQTLPHEQWELIMVDNASTIDTVNKIDLKWHSGARVVREEKLGLTWARIRGFKESSGKYVVMVDDDNVLDENYLYHIIDIFNSHPNVGAIGGRSLPEFEQVPPDWIEDFWGSLALRDLGEKPILSNSGHSSKTNITTYPEYAPIGAGMAIRKQALDQYIHKIQETNAVSVITDRKGSSLASGGDNDIVLTILASQWEIGYFPQLKLKHIIPSGRMNKQYLAKLNHDSFCSWVELLDSHGIRPWPKIPSWTVPMRKIKAYISHRAWENAPNYIRWSGVCGMLEGLAKL